MTALQDLRLASEKSRRQVATDLGFSERHIYRFEKGQAPLKKIHLRAFADYYGVSIAELRRRLASEVVA